MSRYVPRTTFPWMAPGSTDRRMCIRVSAELVSRLFVISPEPWRMPRELREAKRGQLLRH